MKTLIKCLLYICFILVPADMFAMTVCDERGGVESLQEGNAQKAFVKLKHCEEKDNVRVDTLLQLAYLYGVLGYGNLRNEKERAQKYWELITRAAIMGDEDSIVTLAGLYDVGDAVLSISPQPLKRNCLLSIVDYSKSPYEADKINRCLSKKGRGSGGIY